MNELIKSFIIENLEGYEGQQVNICDLAYKICEEINVTGSVHCSAYAAAETIKNNYSLMGEVIDYYNNNFDIQINPFNEPEKAEVLLYIACVENLLNQCEIINKYWSDKKTLNKSFIYVLKKQLKNVYINF